MTNLSVSPITGKPSKLRQMVERSVVGDRPAQPATHTIHNEDETVLHRQVVPPGLQFYGDRNPTPRLRAQVRQSVVGRQPEPQKAQVQRSEADGVAEALTRSMSALIQKMEQVVDVVIQRRAQVQQAQQAPESYDAFLMRAAIGQPGVPQPIPLPKTGPQPGGQVRYLAVRNQASSPAGMAAAAVAQSRQGPDPQGYAINTQRKPGTVSVREAVRRGYPPRY